MNHFNIAPFITRPWLWFSKPITLENLHANPIVEFARWYTMAQRCIWLEFPDALCLSSVDNLGNSDSRMVLLKDFDIKGFVFYSNFDSPKAKQILDIGNASMTFFWDALQRQIRVRGRVVQCDKAESDRYFQTRSRESQIAAWASKQSKVLSSRSELDARIKEFSAKFEGIEVSRPPNWGGMRLKPERIEFWKARSGRLHDRFVYSKSSEDIWQIAALYP